MLSDDEMRGRLQQALDFAGNCFEIEDIVVELKSGRMALLSVDDLATIVHLEVCPRKRILCCDLTYGSWEAEKYQKLQAKVEGLARELECDAIVTSGRKGWEKELGKLGWKFNSISMIYEL